MKLVVIEGPGKRATIQKLLGSDYSVFATKGHVRDLPVHGFGVDLNTFEPKYEVMTDKKDVIKDLRNIASKAEKVLLATDPDREGEAISWHVANILNLNPEENVRIEFNEISQKAVQNALLVPRAIDVSLVDAQQARRVLDRIVGYKLSPILCRKIAPKLSAGRVQSVTLKLVVDREREINNFKPEEWWSVVATLAKIGNLDKPFNATLFSKNGKKIKLQNEEEKNKFLIDIDNQQWVVGNIKKSITHSHPLPPYITSSMQQDALNKLGMSLKRTTSAAQSLYEGVELAGKGKTALITYIRTDSVRVSPDAQKSARDFITQSYGKDFCPENANFYKSKKSAQDAHEAIRPIYINIKPDDVKASLSPDNYKLYKLIYERFLASQMTDARYNSVSLDINVGNYTFRATGRTPIFPGYTVVYQEYIAQDKEEEISISNIPELVEGEVVEKTGIKIEQKFTKPPARFTEASLVKAMEERGIGRPATYTPTVTVLFYRKYCENEGRYIKPTDLGCSITDLLTEHFPDIMDVKFTANMEDELDEIADGKMGWQSVISDFYQDFNKEVEATYSALKTLVEETDEVCDKCGNKMVIRMGKFGKFLACGNYPNCKNIKNIAEDGNKELLLVEETDEVCPECNSPMVVKSGKFGKFLACSNYPNCAFKKNLSGNVESPIKETDQICEKCGHQMVERTGKFGKFLACSNYPNCKNIISINSKVATCPLCGKDIVKKINKKGETFYGCSGYPACTNILKGTPTDKVCPTCGNVLLSKKSQNSLKYFCINPNCDYAKNEQLKDEN